jgi:hypothetical protein
MIYNGSLTVYRIRTDGGFERCFIPKCFAMENSGASVSPSGFADASGLTVYIPSEYASLAPKTAAKDIVIKGDCPFEFDNSSPKTVSESLRSLRTSHPFYTVKTIDDKQYGYSLRHIKVVAD